MAKKRYVVEQSGHMPIVAGVAVNRKVLDSNPVCGAKRIQFELLCLVVNCGAANIFAKWPILTKAASLTHTKAAS